jgi:hypothetical protein
MDFVALESIKHDNELHMLLMYPVCTELVESRSNSTHYLEMVAAIQGNDNVQGNNNDANNANGNSPNANLKINDNPAIQHLLKRDGRDFLTHEEQINFVRGMLMRETRGVFYEKPIHLTISGMKSLLRMTYGDTRWLHDHNLERRWWTFDERLRTRLNADGIKAYSWGSLMWGAAMAGEARPGGSSSPTGPASTVGGSASTLGGGSTSTTGASTTGSSTTGASTTGASTTIPSRPISSYIPDDRRVARRFLPDSTVLSTPLYMFIVKARDLKDVELAPKWAR